MNYKIILNTIKIPLIFIIIMWLIRFVEYYFQISLYYFGIFPRSCNGLIGIITSTFIHLDFSHLINNTYPLIILGSLLFYFYKKKAFEIFFWLFFSSNLWLWCIGRANYHIGASSFVYAIASFLFFSGLIKRKTRLSFVSLIIVFLYGSMIWGIFPLSNNISWEGHIAGFFSGILLSIVYRNEGPKQKKYQWEIDEEMEGEK